jgi:hypothetical protein
VVKMLYEDPNCGKTYPPRAILDHHTLLIPLPHLHSTSTPPSPNPLPALAIHAPARSSLFSCFLPQIPPRSTHFMRNAQTHHAHEQEHGCVLTPHPHTHLQTAFLFRIYGTCERAKGNVRVMFCMDCRRTGGLAWTRCRGGFREDGGHGREEWFG